MDGRALLHLVADGSAPLVWGSLADETVCGGVLVSVTVEALPLRDRSVQHLALEQGLVTAGGRAVISGGGGFDPGRGIAQLDRGGRRDGGREGDEPKAAASEELKSADQISSW
jgi:hypothetical protein